MQRKPSSHARISLTEYKKYNLLAWQRLPGNLRGALWILLAGIGFTGMAVCIKSVGQSMGVWQILLLRSLFAGLYIMPVLHRAGYAVLKTQRPKTHLLRSFLGFCGITSMFLALTHLDLTLATTLGFARILFMIILAAIFLGEVVRLRRTMATIIGFGGVIICLQPGLDQFNAFSLVALLGALFAAGVGILVKDLTRTESAISILVWSYGLIGLLALPLALWSWQTPSLEEIALIALLGGFTAWGQTCMVLGLRAGEASAVAPFDYARLIYAGLAGFLLFAELPDGTTLLGAAVIVASTLYIAWREARLRRQGRQAVTAPTADG